MIGIKTYNDIYLECRKTLKSAGIESFNLEARLIVSAAANKTKEEFYRDIKLYALGETEAKVKDMMDRRLAGEPVAYVLGEAEFMSMLFDIDKNVLIPRMDTELLCELAIKLLRAKGGSGVRVLDLCCGSGCIGIAIAANVLDCRVVLVDNSPAALKLARENIQKNRTVRNTICMSGNALENPPMLLGTFDLIVCNPPYVPTGELPSLDASVRDYEPREALDGGKDGLNFYRSIIPRWKSILKEHGCMLFECGEGQAESVMSMFNAEGFINTAAHKDTAGVQRVVAGII